MACAPTSASASIYAWHIPSEPSWFCAISPIINGLLSLFSLSVNMVIPRLDSSNVGRERRGASPPNRPGSIKSASERQGCFYRSPRAVLVPAPRPVSNLRLRKSAAKISLCIRRTLFHRLNGGRAWSMWRRFAAFAGAHFLSRYRLALRLRIAGPQPVVHDLHRAISGIRSREVFVPLPADCPADAGPINPSPCWRNVHRIAAVHQRFQKL